ncbi:MAG: hypothetical protein QXH73_04360 [Ignisphaera sp.]
MIEIESIDDESRALDTKRMKRIAAATDYIAYKLNIDSVILVVESSLSFTYITIATMVILWLN